LAEQRDPLHVIALPITCLGYYQLYELLWLLKVQSALVRHSRNANCHPEQQKGTAMQQRAAPIRNSISKSYAVIAAAAADVRKRAMHSCQQAGEQHNLFRWVGCMLLWMTGCYCLAAVSMLLMHADWRPAVENL
jgi:hypothetical protein